MHIIRKIRVQRETQRDRIIRFIAEYATAHHNAPSTYEIAYQFSIAQQTVYGHLMKLMAEKRLEQLHGKWKLPQAEYTPPPLD